MPSFSVTFSTTMPRSDGSTRNALIPREPAPPVRNIAITTPACPPFVHHCLRPLSTHASPSRRAVARIAAASDPASGSVKPKPAITSPVASASSHCALLRVRAQLRDRAADHRVHRDGDGRAGVDLRELFDRERVRDVIRADAAEPLGDEHPHQPRLGQLRVQRARKGVRAVPLGDVRRDLTLRDLARDVPDRALVVADLEPAVVRLAEHRRSLERA